MNAMKKKGRRSKKDAADLLETRDEAGAPPPLRTSGTLSSQVPGLEGAQGMPVVDSGSPVAPEDLGRQFLRDATEQDNFESGLTPALDELEVQAPDDLVSESTHLAAGLDERDLGEGVPGSAGARADEDEDEGGSLADDLDPSAGSIRDASLLDRPPEDLYDDETDQPTRVQMDDQENFRAATDEEAREREMELTRQRLREGRGGLPGSGSSSGGRSRLAARRAARRIQSSRRAADVVSEATGLGDVDSALAALGIVCAGIVRRIEPREAGDFIAQLPSEIRAHVTNDVLSGPERSLTRETIECELARRFDVDPERASELAGQVGTAIEHLVSAGEMAQVRAQLPEDLRSIFTEEVLHRTP